MSKFCLSTIEDVFDVSGRGIILAPGFPVAEYSFNQQYEVEIESPVGGNVIRHAVFEVPFQSPPPKVRKYFCRLIGVKKGDVAIGGKLWILGKNESEVRKST